MSWCQTFHSRYLKLFNAPCLSSLRTASRQWETSGMPCMPIPILGSRKNRRRYSLPQELGSKGSPTPAGASGLRCSLLLSWFLLSGGWACFSLLRILRPLRLSFGRHSLEEQWCPHHLPARDPSPILPLPHHMQGRSAI